MGTFINTYSKDGYTYRTEFDNTVTLGETLADDIYTFTIKIYITRTSTLASPSISGTFGAAILRYVPGVPTWDSTYSFTNSVSKSGLDRNVEYLLTQGTIIVPTSFDVRYIMSKYLSATDLQNIAPMYNKISYNPPVLSSISVSNVSTNSVRLNYSFTAPYDCRVDVAYVKLGDSSFTYVNATGYSSVTNGSYDLAGLDSYTKYYFKIKVTCLNKRVTESLFSATLTQTLPILITQITIPETYVNEGETVTITADVLPTDADIKTLAWTPMTSSNFQVLSQSANTITIKGIAKGDVTLSAAATDGSGISDSETLHVMRYAQSLNVATPQKQLYQNTTWQINTYIAPSGSTDTNITYESSDTNVATVNSSGLVSTHSDGTATITATLEREHLETDLTATVEIVVAGYPTIFWLYHPLQESFISPETIKRYYDNLFIVRDMIYNKLLIDVPTLTEPDITRDRATRLTDMLNVFNTIESDIDIVNAGYVAGGYTSNYYDSPVTWTSPTTDLQDKLRRWAYFAQEIWDSLYFVIDQR
jgi:uncharacterized protein YjdB